MINEEARKKIEEAQKREDNAEGKTKRQMVEVEAEDEGDKEMTRSGCQARGLELSGDRSPGQPLQRAGGTPPPRNTSDR